MKRWAVAHPIWLFVLFACGWHAALLVHPLVAAGMPVVLIGALGWWREAGLWTRPHVRWLFAVPLVVAGLPFLGPWSLVVVSVELARGFGQYLLRPFHPWWATVVLGFVLVPEFSVEAVALSFCLTAVRWRLNSVWPLVVAHAVLVNAPWWVAVALVGYGVWLLLTYRVVDMSQRPTVRVLCFDAQGRVLLLGWPDPSDGTTAWDSPGGGIEPGETPVQAARRELREETGLAEECVLDEFVLQGREAHWNNIRFVGIEPYYLARVRGPVGEATPEPHEVGVELRWVEPERATSLPGRLQVPAIADVARRLTASDSRRPPGDRCR